MLILRPDFNSWTDVSLPSYRRSSNIFWTLLHQMTWPRLFCCIINIENMFRKIWCLYSSYWFIPKTHFSLGVFNSEIAVANVKYFHSFDCSYGNILCCRMMSLFLYLSFCESLHRWCTGHPTAHVKDVLQDVENKDLRTVSKAAYICTMTTFRKRTQVTSESLSHSSS
jgi:hypothetical protein